ncbi:glutathione S-transferase family protein [Sedimenticola sp.]|uniref:glutathione S-transferase family protein n=1 Tax=Sedimenticola sp. TaxID=1940285 RepID=UPI003D0C0B6F
MGQLQNGRWVTHPQGNRPSTSRQQNDGFRGWVTATGETGPGGERGFKAEKGRYHLYVSLACPWAHRTLIFRELKQLKDYIGITIVDPLLLDNGWEVDDPLYNFEFLYQLYLKADPGYEGRVTVPVLWDKHSGTMVGNESSDIIRMLNSAFDHLTGNTDDYYPMSLRLVIDSINHRVYETINTGVYKAGFARDQSGYQQAVESLFKSLDWVEGLLSRQRYLAGDRISEADWRLFTTLVRFDAVYYGHFKCNKYRLVDYPALLNYVRELYQVPGVANTVDLDQIKRHYYLSHRDINPKGLIPAGPEHSFAASHNRGRMSATCEMSQL